ncbi:DUF5134 domain-containing protein [Streptomyces sp. NPDC051784]|uniref:DUF5134 domain-containing protein n=1 Tax=Streptomyces sp. NPDC051784 TaxID=3155805 RepID=UPI0034497E23
MHGPVLSGWLLVALCGATGAYCLLRARDGTARERASARAEALMGFGMAAMAVPAAVAPPPGWLWAVYATVFGAAALEAATRAGAGGHHLHHLIGSLSMVYMALAMAPGTVHGAASAHAGHAAGASGSAGGVPVLTGLLLLYYALYVLRSAGRLVPGPVGVTAGAGGGAVPSAGWGDRPELARACRLAMGTAMFAMLLTL